MGLFASKETSREDSHLYESATHLGRDDLSPSFKRTSKSAELSKRQPWTYWESIPECPEYQRCHYCGFCDSTVFPHRDWHCPECGQYNGFNKDGDIWSIQERMRMRSPATSKSNPVRGVWKQQNRLCQECEDRIDESYQNELSAETIKLCNQCETLIASLH